MIDADFRAISELHRNRSPIGLEIALAWPAQGKPGRGHSAGCSLSPALPHEGVEAVTYDRVPGRVETKECGILAATRVAERLQREVDAACATAARYPTWHEEPLELLGAAGELVARRGWTRGVVEARIAADG